MFAIRSSRPSPSAAQRPVRFAPSAALVGLASLSLLLAACGGSSQQPTDTATSSPAGVSPAPSTSAPTTTTPASPSQTPSTTKPSTTKPSPSSSTASGSATTTTVVSSRVSYPWNWPAEAYPGVVKHTARTAVPELVRISAGRHPNDPGEYGFERISFTFTSGFPSYRFLFDGTLVADPSGRTVPLLCPAGGPLTIVFSNAQAHTSTLPVRSSIVAQPARPLAFHRLVDYAQAGDFEGVLTYGLGMSIDIPHSNPEYAIRVVEVETVSSTGVHSYVVAFDVQLGLVARH